MKPVKKLQSWVYLLIFRHGLNRVQHLDFNAYMLRVQRGSNAFSSKPFKHYQNLCQLCTLFIQRSKKQTIYETSCRRGFSLSYTGH